MTTDIKKRYCTDMKVPVGVFDDDELFFDRLQLMGKLDDFNQYAEMINRLGEQEYFRLYGETKENAIKFIKSTSTYEELNKDDMNKYSIREDLRGLPNNDIYNKERVGDRFISIDMIKGCFNVFVTYSKMLGEERLFNNGKHNYYKFIDQFTDEQHIKESKYIRQVIFGNCNPRRQTTLEKYFTAKLLCGLLDNGYIRKQDIVALHHDEIIISVNDFTIPNIRYIKGEMSLTSVPFSYQLFDIWQLKGTHAFLKNVIDGKNAGQLEIKGGMQIEMPAIHRFLSGQEPNENDLIFIDSSSHKKAKLLEGFDIRLVKEKEK